MKVKVSELIGAALDWAVAKAEGVDVEGRGILRTNTSTDGGNDWVPYAPSRVWSQGGPVIDNAKISLDTYCYDDVNCESVAMAGIGNEYPHEEERIVSITKVWFHDAHIEYRHTQTGPTPLVAGMRCFVSSKFGDEIEIPDELV